jgi:DNA helicase IV
MEVLIEKRSNHKMTDIIKSIQSNQNSIIRENHKSNIIVQGCAGSGKTMILLHRLSYLKYNNFLPNSKFVKIITPNKEFSMFINDLANSLELEDIERITMLDYLWNFCLQYQSLFSIENRKNEYGLNFSKSELEVNADAINFLIGLDILSEMK